MTTTRQRLAEVDERIDRIGNVGWLLWLRQLEAQRADLRQRLADESPD